ncbi:MAG TPA: hypothetical protein VLF71_00955 [Candidatus Saccharimonadales bacterium]|nr:hypothetical protein [Candidatus Saccharimonadales bacterium]
MPRVIEGPVVLLETRPGQANITETRQGAIGAGLEAEGITPVYVDVGSPKAFTPDSSAVRTFCLRDPRDPSRLVPANAYAPVVPDAYRFRDVPHDARPAFATEVPGYNDGELCTALLGRISMRMVLARLGFGKHTAPTTITRAANAAATLKDMAPGMVFVKPGEDGAYTDVGADRPGALPRRARYVHTAEMHNTIARRSPGRVIVQPDVSIPSVEIAGRLGLKLGEVDPTWRQHHAIRLYQMTDGQPPDLAEVRFQATQNIGQPEPPYYKLLEPGHVFDAIPEIRVLHSALATEIQGRYGLNYVAVDYFMGKTDAGDEVPLINAIHARPWLPSVREDLSWRTVETEVQTLSRLALQGQSPPPA